jgi:hypothetical protein
MMYNCENVFPHVVIGDLQKQEAPTAERRLLADAAPHYDEFVVLHYTATNELPFPFRWGDFMLTSQNYGSALLRISREYERRF